MSRMFNELNHISDNWHMRMTKRVERRFLRHVVRRSEHEIKSNAEIELFTKPSRFYFNWSSHIHRKPNFVHCMV